MRLTCNRLATGTLDKSGGGVLPAVDCAKVLISLIPLMDVISKDVSFHFRKESTAKRNPINGCTIRFKIYINICENMHALQISAHGLPLTKIILSICQVMVTGMVSI